MLVLSKTLSQHYVLLPFTWTHFSWTIYSSKLKRKCPEARRGVLPASHTGKPVVSIHMLPMTSLLINRTGSLLSQLGSKSENANRERKVLASLPPFHRNRPRVLNRINDNYCVQCVTRLKDCVCVPGKLGLNPSLVVAKDEKLPSKSETVNLLVNSCVANAHSVTGLPQKNGVNPNYCHNCTEIKYVKDVCCVGHLSSANLLANVPTVAINPPVGARLHQFWEKWEALGSSPKVIRALRKGYTLPFRFRPNLTRSLTVISNYVNPQRQSHLLEALYQLVNKNAVEPVANQNSLGFYNRLFLVPKPNNRWRPILDLSTWNTFLNTESFKMETPETIRTSLQIGEWVTSIDFKDAYFHIPIQSVQKVHVFSHPGSVLPVQSPTLWSVHSTHGVHSGDQRGKTDGFTEGCKNPPVPRRLVGESHIPPNLSPAYTDLVSSLSRNRLAGEQEVRTGSKTGFQLRRLPVQPQGGQGQTNTRALADLNRQDIVNSVRCSVPSAAVYVPHRAPKSHRKASPPRSTLYMRPIQWHLKNNWRVPESLQKVIPLPRSLHPHLRWLCRYLQTHQKKGGVLT